MIIRANRDTFAPGDGIETSAVSPPAQV